MRKLYSLVSFVAIFACGMMSCTNAGNDPENVYEPRELRIVLGGEFIKVSEEPMFRSTNMDKSIYIGINVLRKSSDADDNTPYTPYAYGVFTNQSGITLTLQPIYKYKFECTTIKEDHDKIALDSEGLRDPFNVGEKAKYPKDNLNQFLYSESDNLRGISLYPTYVTVKEDENGITLESEKVEYPSILRCYCEVSDFELGSKNEIYLDLKVTSFAVLIKADVPDGELTWEGSVLDFKDSSLKPGETEKKYYFASDNITGCFRDPSNTANSVSEKISFTWVRANGQKTGETQWLSFMPGRIKTLNINLEAGDKNLTFTFPGEQNFDKDDDTDVSVK